jgi:Xaa-Pro dipeptidase
MPMLHFTPAEYKARQARTIKELERRGMHGIIMFRQESMYYLTGHDTFGYCFFQAMYLGTDGKLTLVTRWPDAIVAKRVSVVKDCRIWVNKPDADPSLDLRAVLAEHGCAGKRIGIEYDAYGLTAAIYRRLDAALTDFCHLEDASDLVTKLRYVKSPAELAYTRKAAELADRALVVGNRMARSGANEGDILAGMQSEIFRGDGDWPGNDQIIGSGEKALIGRHTVGRQRIKKNDQLTIEWAGAYRRYHAAMMRTIFIGKRPARQYDMHKVAVEAHWASVEALKPGNTCGHVFAAYARVCDKHGYKKHRHSATGYSMGTTYQPTWMDWPMFYENNPAVIVSGNVFFVHTLIFDQAKSLAVAPGQSYIVTARGNTPLSKSSLDLVNND